MSDSPLKLLVCPTVVYETSVRAVFKIERDFRHAGMFRSEALATIQEY